VNLAGQTNVRGEFCFDGETVSFEFAHFAGVAFEEFDATGRAASVAAAAVKNIDAGVFDNEDEFLSGRCFSFDQTISSFRFDLWHLNFAPEIYVLSA
jgi:hypothetical protein